MTTWRSSSLGETSKIAKEILCDLTKDGSLKGPVILGLVGELGAGKTAFTKALAKELKIKERVSSPTFVLMRRYVTKHKRFKTLYHFDCYRLEEAKELHDLYWGEIMKNEKALVVLEWADLVKKELPKKTIWLKFSHGKKKKERVITKK
ncbi:MAG: tRNA (adenosine(37)-N6)-threonylcarbamoyltransferase complex ATPase subunit type 1 TsaE [Anaplasmataceae bacterium]|nr:tRNA (adenosine(37)-N6)-threonylcarbamoyltransferase complex ATPase subunit type 1 TsaE [Anaplasmataceae bacterium]